MADTRDTLQSKLDHLPDQPGCYLFRNAKKEILYVGKAAVLADRVRSYFQKGSDQTPKTSLLVSEITDLETIVTRSELEALILESNLIKRHRPRFNIVLRDDKQYPYLRLPIKEAFPRLSIVRRVQKDGALYYGPYTPAGALRETLKVIRKAFPLATCEIEIDGKADRACIEFEIKRCMAPCTGNQSRDDYHLIVKQVRQFLEGRDRELLDGLRQTMESAADREEFEEAARIRDRLFSVERTLEKQRITQVSTTDQDVVGLARQGTAADLQLLFVRGGLLIGRKDFFWPQSADSSDEELVRSAIEQFYNKEGQPPKELLVPTDLSDAPLIEQWLSDKRGDAIRLLAPERGTKHQLVLLAEENAAAAITDHLRNEALDRQATAELKRLLRLDIAPRRIEGFDISNIMGNQSVASLVVWEDGQAKKADYRKFRIQTVEGANDFASMQEAVMRRYGATEDLARPDLVLIDGGLGQLSAAIEGLKQVGQEQIPIIGLAKARGEKEERIFLPGRKNPIVLRPTSPATHLVQRIRDEAHRFAVTYHRNLRGKALLSSELDQIAGIGKIRRRRLLKQFGSLQHIAAATDEQLKTAGLDPATIAALRTALTPA
ncbi:excinuclease ABC subunit UvrC [Nitrospira defluvii]|uniref:UvrABC system protein C n=1 Tax=Nitrospira defluvii TaxID=330214 RepID=A0ABN7KM58_9BACT|nr:excinuclease ABC subunit UvrC [Nitrospira defluvii]CAE6700297.1 UvrABC system protein C [Nitrospira defluvii]